jgi:hypothetical protein
MAGYLDEYGAGDERRARIIKTIVVSVVGLAILCGLFYFFFRNYRQEQQAKRFFELLEAHNYEAAYNLWNPSEQDRRDYPMPSFMRDWGPPGVDVKNFSILDAESCGNNVIVDTDLGNAGDKKVWVNRQTLELSFGPYQFCPQQNRIYNLYRNVKYQLRGRTYKTD